jgi:hypothetical protein
LTKITVPATHVAGAATGRRPIRDVRFGLGAHGDDPIAIARNVTRHANVRLQTSGTGWVVGRVYRPHIPLTAAYPGFTTAYYVSDSASAVTLTT